MINAVAPRNNTRESFSSQEIEKSLAGVPSPRTSADHGNDTENLPQIDCYIPSEQRLAEEERENSFAMQQAVKETKPTDKKTQPIEKRAQAAEKKDDKKNEKKKVMEDIVNTLKDFFKAPSNIYLHKKMNDAAADGDLEKASKMNDIKAEYNMLPTTPAGEKAIRR